MLSDCLEAVDRAGKIGLNYIGGAAVVAGVNGRLGGTLEEHIERAGVREIVRTAHVAVHEVDAGAAKAGQGQLAPAAFQVVERSNVRIRQITFEHESETRPDETRSSGDQYSQDVEMILTPTEIDCSSAQMTSCPRLIAVVATLSLVVYHNGRDDHEVRCVTGSASLPALTHVAGPSLALVSVAAVALLVACVLVFGRQVVAGDAPAWRSGVIWLASCFSSCSPRSCS